jgi:flagellin
VTSILTNSGAVSAVDHLRSISTARTDKQQEVASGLRVKTASDNTAYWSIATTMRSDNKALSAAEDSLGLGAAVVDVAFAGMNAAIDVVQDIKDKLVTAREAGVDLNKINLELTELKQQIYTIVDGSYFNLQNWLSRKSAADDRDHEIVGSFARDAAGNVSVKTLTYSMTNAVGTNHLVDEDSQTGILTNPTYAANLGAATDWVLVHGRNVTAHTEFHLDSTTTSQDVDEMISVSDAMLLAMTDAAANLGSLVSRITMQKDFVADLQDTQDRGVGRLVDADMNEAASRLRAVDVQQSLATQALAIANQTPMNLMPLLQ